jgi:hypothetical protein
MPSASGRKSWQEAARKVENRLCNSYIVTAVVGVHLAHELAYTKMFWYNRGIIIIT